MYQNKRWLWKENGFESKESMDSSHKPVLNLIKGLNSVSNIMDLGCGNGYLLKKSGLVPYGIDTNPKAIKHAKNHILPLYSSHFYVKNINELQWNEKFDVVVVSIGRFFEMNKREVNNLKRSLSSYARNIVVYAYSDWLDKAENLKSLCRNFKFKCNRISEKESSAACLVSTEH